MDEITGLHFEQEIPWERVFSDWCIRETGQDWGWERVWREHGFDNWPDWRMTYVERFGLLGRTWGLYTIEKPLEFVPHMYVGAYKGWKKYYPQNALQVQFKNLERIEENQKVMSILHEFPKDTTLIGIKHADRFGLFEGTHCAAALTLMARQSLSLGGRVRLALTELRPGEKALFEANTTQAPG